MEDKRARFVSRSPGVGGAMASPSTGTGSGGRSQWRGMDLHTTTPSSHRRAMYISPVPLQAYANANAANVYAANVNAANANANAANANAANTTNASATNIHSHSHSAASTPAAAGTSGEAMRMRSEAAALSARNQVLHRRLSERKRFDSADYAMKLVRQAMQGDAKDAPAPASSPSPATGGSAMAALQSPRLSPTHGRMVFAHALKDGRASGDADVEMKDVSNQEMHAAPARGYGALQSSGAKTASAVMSARNIMIQRKLQEKRHFDSADYQLARLGVATDVNMEDVGEPALEPAALTLNISSDASSPLNSPSAARAAITRSNQMSPSVRASSGATGFGGRADIGRYGSLGGGRAQAAKPQNDLRRNTLLRQQENFIAAQNPASASSPQHQQQQQQPSPMPTPAGKQQPYGKLMAANILFRKNLKDRQRFDSADYQMEAAAKQAERAGRSAADTPDNNAVTQSPNATVSTSNQDDEPNSPVMKPQAKHIKLSEDNPLGGRAVDPTGAPAQRGGWAAHAAVAAARQSQSQAREDGVRVAARNVLLSRKLSEGKKLFDSGEYFAAKDKAARAGSSRGHMQR